MLIARGIRLHSLMGLQLEICDSFIQHSIKLVRNTKYRHKIFRAIVSGAKIISELPASLSIHNMVMTRDFFESQKCKDMPTRIRSSKNLFTSLDVMKVVLRENCPEGLFAEIGIPAVASISKWSQTNGNILILYKVSDPGNLGTLIRTANAFGWCRVVLVDSCVDPFGLDCIRSSMGASLKVPTYSIAISDLQAFLNRNKILPVIADSNGTDSSLDLSIFMSSSITPSMGLILGSESHGFKDFPSELYEQCHKVSIPMKNGADSLNLAVSGGILMNLLSAK